MTSATAGRGHLAGQPGDLPPALGDYRQAIDLHTQALAIARDTGDRRGEDQRAGQPGDLPSRLGDYRQAIDLHTQALAIARDTGDRRGETSALSSTVAAATDRQVGVVRGGDQASVVSFGHAAPLALAPAVEVPDGA